MEIKKLFFLFLIFGTISTTLAHDLAKEEKGKEIFEKLQRKEINCSDLSENDFHNIGEYFMGKMAGKEHEAMNEMMEKMMGKDNAQKMHIVMGKRFSDCQLEDQVPQNMMAMMGQMGNSMFDNWNKIFFPLKFYFFLTIILKFVWLFVGILAIIFLLKKLQRKI